MNFDEKLNNLIDDDSEMYLGENSKKAVLVFEQGTKSALNQISLSKDFDSMDVAKMSNGGTILAHNAITTTATSTEIDCRGFKNVRIESEVTAWTAGNITPSIIGSEVSGGTFGAIYRDVAGTMTAYTFPAQAAIGKNIYIVSGVPNFIKITQTIQTTATSSVRITPFN